MPARRSATLCLTAVLAAPTGASHALPLLVDPSELPRARAAASAPEAEDPGRHRTPSEERIQALAQRHRERLAAEARPDPATPDASLLLSLADRGSIDRVGLLTAAADELLAPAPGFLAPTARTADAERRLRSRLRQQPR